MRVNLSGGTKRDGAKYRQCGINFPMSLVVGSDGVSGKDKRDTQQQGAVLCRPQRRLRMVFLRRAALGGIPGGQLDVYCRDPSCSKLRR